MQIATALASRRAIRCDCFIVIPFIKFLAAHGSFEVREVQTSFVRAANKRIQSDST